VLNRHSNNPCAKRSKKGRKKNTQKVLFCSSLESLGLREESEL